MIRFIEAVSDKARKNTRVVFDCGGGIYAVVKIFSDEGSGRPSTAKLWDLTSSSYEKTKSYWSTQDAVDVTQEQIESALDTLRTLCARVGKP